VQQSIDISCGASAFAAVRRAAWRRSLSINVSCPSGPQQQTRRSGVRRPKDGADRQRDEQADFHTERVGIVH